MIEERTVVSSGIPIWTDSMGDPEHPAILFIAGAGSHAHFWSDSFCRPFLDKGYYLIRFDHRDVGLSGKSPEDYEIEDLSSDVINILNDYGLNNAHFVGHSMGGYLIQLLASEHSNRVKSATIISSGPLGETPALFQQQTPEENSILRETWLMMMRNRPSQDFDESLEGFMGVWRRLNGKAPFDEELARHYTKEFYTRSRYPVGVHQRHMKAIQKATQCLKEYTPIFKNIHIPLLFIQGAEDYLIPPSKGGKALKEAFPNGQLTIIPEMGHMLFNHEIEATVAEKILNFIDFVEKNS